MSSKNEIIFYQADDLPEHIEVRLDEDTVWLSLNQIAQLFNRDKSVVSRHLRNVYKEGELIREATVAKNATVQMEETLFRQWFVQRKGLNYDSDDFHDDPDSKNHENQAHHKNQGSDNGEADERSEEVSLYDAIELIGGGTPKTSVEEYWNGNIKWLAGGDIASNHKSIITNSEKTIAEEGLNNSSAKLLPKFSTVISASGTVGKYCIL